MLVILFIFLTPQVSRARVGLFELILFIDGEIFNQSGHAINYSL